VYLVVQLAARAHAREGADRAARADRGAIDYAVRMQLGVGADAAVLQITIRADAHAVAERNFADHDDVDVDEDVASDADFATDVDARRISERDAFQHQRVGAL